MTQDELDSLDANFRASNYLSVAQLFLNKYVDINDLKQENLKEKVFGHWGCCPGINYFYTHINRFFKNTKEVPNIIVGTGHGSPALISNLYINGDLGDLYSKYKHGYDGINNLIKDFGKNMVLQTEISPLLPNVILAGGELGNAISTGYGTIISNAKQTTFVIVGDGEFEAGTTIPSLLCNKIINSKLDGFLVILVNLNGYKMTSRSLISLSNFEKILESFDYQVFQTSIGNHEETSKIFDFISEIQKKWYNGEKCKIPVVILNSPKGFSAPSSINNIDFVNTHLSHKVSLLKKPHEVENSVEIIKNWLFSYRPNDLFCNGVPTNKVKSNIYELKNLLSEKRKIIKNNDDIEKDLITKNNNQNTMQMLTDYLIKCTCPDFLVFSPDESISNGLKDFVDIYGIKYCDTNFSSSINVKPNGRVIEILNEIICITMLYGYLKKGGDGVFITYEAFSPLISSFISQCYKFYKLQKLNLNLSLHNSLKIIITSLGWRNTFTHQNPDILNTLLSKETDLIQVYFPSESNQALLSFKEMEQTSNSIQVLYASKTNLKTFRTIQQAIEDVKKGYWVKVFNENVSNEKILIIAIGDVITNECLLAGEKIKNCNITVLSIIKSSVIDNINLDVKKYKKVFVYCTCYDAIIRSKLSKCYDTTNWSFKGYKDSILGTYKNVLESNEISHKNIIKKIKEVFYEF